MKGLRVWTAVMLACLVHGRAAGQVGLPKLAPAKPTTTVINTDALPKSPVVGAGQVQITSPSNGVMQIQTTKPNNVVNWESFNIGSDATVKIGQSAGPSAVLLNNIVGKSQTPTVINGALKAMEGQSSGRVYIYDPAGIVFGAGASVNLNSLIASTLRFDEARLQAGGLLMPGTDAALRAALEDLPSGMTRPGSILVEGGASITVDNGGQLMLAAPGVFNEGRLYAPDGQVILAAGDKVYLASPDVSSTGSKLRGLVVEVQNASGKSSTAENAGEIKVDRGNASMVGYAVNQIGKVSASTSVNLNGSIYLKAIDTALVDQGKKDVAKTESAAGSVTLGAASVTEVIPSDDGKTLTLANLKQFNKSEVQIIGKNISLLGLDESGPGAQILAKGGAVDIQSVSLPVIPVSLLTQDVVRVTLGQGSLIDVSGMNSANLEMSKNIISVDLRGTELADNVLLRDSPLYGKKINVDIRKGTGIANIDGWLKLVEYKLDQVNTEGGSIKISSVGAVVQQADSLLRLDGGGVNYLAGYANASRLRLGNSVVDVALAKTGVAYAQVINLPDGSANWEPGYYQGSKAGSLDIAGQVVGLRGDMSATTNPGFYQRSVSQGASSEPYTKLTSPYPSGGKLTLNVQGVGQPEDGNDVAGLNLGTVSSTGALPALDTPFTPNELTSISQMALNINGLMAKGFTSFSAAVSGNIGVDAALNLPAKASLSLSAAEAKIQQGSGNITVNASITAPGGTVALAASRQLELAPSVSISTAGRWTNDAFSLLDPLSANVATNAGSMSLKAHQLVLGSQANLDASAGVWLDEFKKIKYGSPGTISLLTQANDSATADGLLAGIQLKSGAGFRAYGFTGGGQLVLRDNLVTIARAADLPNIQTGGLLLTPEFFNQGGFSGFEISSLINQKMAGSGDLKILAGAQINPLTSSWLLRGDANLRPTGDMAGVAGLVSLPLSGLGMVRPASSLSLIAAGQLSLASGALISLDPQSSVTLLANDQLTVQGSVSAPAGRILLGLTSTEGFDLSRSIWLGVTSMLNAQGSAQRMYTDARGVTRGEMLDGGLIQIGQASVADKDGRSVILGFTSANGYIVAEKGAGLNVDGLGPVKLSLMTASGVVDTALSSNAGTIDIRSSQGMLLDAALSAKSAPTARGGTLNLVLDSQFSTPLDPLTQEDYPRILNLLGAKTSTTILPSKWLVSAPLLSGSDEAGWLLTGTKAGATTTRNPGEAWISTAAIAGGGFGRLQFKSDGSISFNLGDGGNALTAKDAVILDSPILLADRYDSKVATGKTANTMRITAPFVQMGGQSQQIMGYVDGDTEQYKYYQNQLPFMSPTARFGVASLMVNATYLDLSGTTSLQGFTKANLNSSADTRLVSGNSFFPEFQSPDYINAHPELLQNLPGQFTMVGELLMSNAQLYATTLSSFKLSVLDAPNNVDGTLTFLSNGQPAKTVYAAGGALSAVASSIVQAGVIKAPLGQISLGETGTTKRLVYQPGSVTSVKGEASVLYGELLNGSVPSASTWSVSGNNGSGLGATLLLAGANPSNLYRRALPSKQIDSLGTDITVNAGAVLDASAGGQLLAYEFTPGKGGSQDILNTPNTFAILPGFQGSVAPVDPNNPDTSLRAGDKVYLSASAGLAAGTYTLLPAHYALLPGGFSVSVSANTLGMTAAGNRVLPDGSALVSGSLMAASQGSGTLRGFQVMSGDVIRKKSEFTVTDAQSYFAKQAEINLLALPEMAADAGYMRMLAGVSTNTPGSLHMNGQIRLLDGAMDISVLGSSLRIKDNNDSGEANVLSVRDLNQMRVSSLMLGGVRDTVRDGVGELGYRISQLTENLTLDNPGSLLSAKDIMLVAQDVLLINNGAGLTAPAAPKFDVAKLSLAADAALLRLTGGADIQVDHSSLPSFAKGTLTIQQDARIQTSGSAYFDATASMSLSGWTPAVGNLGLLGLAAPGIFLTDTPGAAIAGLELQPAQLQALNQPGQRLSLNSFNNPISFASNLELGTNTDEGIASLTLKSAGLQALAAGLNVSVRAKSVHVQGLTALGIPAAPAFSGASLVVNSQQMTLGDGVFALAGFDNTSLTATAQIKGTGDQGLLVAFGNLGMTANEFSADNAKSLRVVSTGALTLAGGANDFVSQTSTLGGELAFTAARMVSNANISLPSGLLTFNHAQDQQKFQIATGSLEINGGTLNLTGARRYFGKDAAGVDLWAEAPAGSMVLNAATMALNGGTLDVSAQGSAAGALAIASTSAFSWSDQVLLRGQANADQTQGQFSLTTDAIGNFSGLNNKVREAGFTETLSYRQTLGNLSLGANDRIRASNISLTVDKGSIDIAGTLDASGPKGGSIAIFAAQEKAGDGIGNIVLRSTALLDARSTASIADTAGSLGRGGSVLLATSTWDGSAPSARSLAQGALVDLQGGEIKTSGLLGKDGSVLVRVPRTIDNANAAFKLAGTTFSGATPTLEAFKVYALSDINADHFSSDILNPSAQIYREAQSFADNRPSLSGFNVRPGVEIRSDAPGTPSNMFLSVNEFDSDASRRGLDLSAWRFNGQPINLTLRAAGNLTIHGSISDGFVNPGTSGNDRSGMAMPNWALGSGPSADINLVAGADFLSANPLATIRSSSLGDFTLGFADRRAFAEGLSLTTEQTNAPITINDMPVALVRTGTGRINLAAARDVTLKLLSVSQLVDADNNILVYTNQTTPSSDTLSLKHSVMLVGASIYTAGELDTDAGGANPPTNLLNPHYLGSTGRLLTTPAMFGKNGGAISIKAGRHIQGPVSKGGFFQNGDYSLTFDTNNASFYIPDYLSATLQDTDLASSAQVAKALTLANAKADKIIAELKADTANYKDAFKSTWDDGAYIPVIVTEKGGGTYADSYVSVFDFITGDDQTVYNKNLDSLKSGKLTQVAGEMALAEVMAIISRAVDKAKLEAQLNADSLAAQADIYSSAKVGSLMGSSVQITAVSNDEHFATKDWAPTSVSPLVNNWLFRQGRRNTNLPTAWYARTDYFNQSLATLGGGDLNINAGGAIRDIYASTASNAYATGGNLAWTLKEQGGGDLTMMAGGDIAGAAVYVQKGKASISTQASLVAGDNLVYRGDSQNIHTYVDTANGKPVVDDRVALGTLFAMGDAQLNVTARKNLSLAAVYNPTLTEQSKYNRSGSIEKNDFNQALLNDNKAIPALANLYPILKYPFFPLYQDAGYWNPANAGTKDFEDYAKVQQTYAQFASFSSYSASSSLKLLAMTGASTLINDSQLVSLAGGEMVTNELVTGTGFGSLGLDRLYTAAPSQVRAVAMSGGLSTLNGFALMPSSNAQLSLWAKGDVVLNNGSAGATHILDVKAEAFSPAQAPRVLTGLDIRLIRDSYVTGAAAHADNSADDGFAANPVGTSSIVSLRDVVGDSAYAQYSLNLSKSAAIMAGRDIVNLGIAIQNTRPGDASLLQAGRDIRDETTVAKDCTDTASQCVQHTLTGPGTLLVAAGRDIDLGNQAGIVTRGNLDNPYLPEGGASIQLTTAGLRPDYGSLKTYTQTFNNAEKLQDFVAPILQKLGITPIQPLDLDDGALQESVSADLKALENPKLKDKERIALYFRMLDSASYLLEPGALQDASQNQLLVKVLGNSRKLKYDDSNKLTFALLNTASKLSPETLTVSEQNKRFIEILNNASLLKKQDGKNLDLTYFDGLIASLLPTLTGETPVGNLSNHSSQIKTEQGGSIDIFTPTGSVFAGLTMGKAVAKPSNQGLFTVRGGDINALVKNDFLVNQGRVFTLGGGDITLVSQFGNLEAGKGAKTASSAPPPLIVIGKDGSITVDVSGAVAGSGIATLSTKPGQPVSDVNTVAPRGYVDAGDAGIQSTGNVNINSPVVRNADNIAASSGVSNAQAPAVVAAPTAPPPPPAASGNAGDDAKKSLASTNTSTALANLSVELLGFGDVSAGSTAPSAAGTAGTSSGDKDKDEKDEKDKDEKGQKS